MKLSAGTKGSPIITLLSDLGLADTSVANTKAILMNCLPDATIVDLSHDVSRYDLQEAAYIVASAVKHFPSGTVHILLVDVFSSNTSRLLLAKKEGQFFIAPDNGLLSFAFGDDVDGAWMCREFTGPFLFAAWLNSVCDIINELEKNTELSYEQYKIKDTRRLLKTRTSADSIDCNILYIDHYGNVVLDITKSQFEQTTEDKEFRIKIFRKKDITTISGAYNDVTPGDPLCRFNGAGYLEVALNQASMASLLGLDKSSASYQSIKIFLSSVNSRIIS